MTVHSSQYVKCFIKHWRSGSWSLRSFLMLALSRGCNSLTFALVGPGGLAAKAPGGEVEGGVWRCCLDAEEEALWTFCQLHTGSTEKPALEAAACAGEPPLVLCWSASQQNKRLTPGTVSSFSSFLMEALCGGRLFSCRGEVKWCGKSQAGVEMNKYLCCSFSTFFIHKFHIVWWNQKHDDCTIKMRNSGLKFCVKCNAWTWSGVFCFLMYSRFSFSL